ncbi:hypothetical protein GOBAR_DD34712 [Gossypium barbadense]|nr:hypothetical protein GOBAR_DD34712 [Gossypium barbadense]
MAWLIRFKARSLASATRPLRDTLDSYRCSQSHFSGFTTDDSVRSFPRKWLCSKAMRLNDVDDIQSRSSSSPEITSTKSAYPSRGLKTLLRRSVFSFERTRCFASIAEKARRILVQRRPETVYSTESRGALPAPCRLKVARLTFWNRVLYYLTARKSENFFALPERSSLLKLQPRRATTKDRYEKGSRFSLSSSTLKEHGI